MSVYPAIAALLAATPIDELTLASLTKRTTIYSTPLDDETLATGNCDYSVAPVTTIPEPVTAPMEVGKMGYINLTCKPVGIETQGQGAGYPAWACFGELERLLNGQLIRSTAAFTTFESPGSPDFCNLVRAGFIPDNAGICIGQHVAPTGVPVTAAGVPILPTSLPGAEPRPGTLTYAPPMAPGGPSTLGGKVSTLLIEDLGAPGIPWDSIEKRIIAALGRQTFTADEACFFFAEQSGTACPAPEDFGFVGAGRFEAVSFATWKERLAKFLGIGGGGPIPVPTPTGNGARITGILTPAPTGVDKYRNLIVIVVVVGILWYVATQ